MKPGQNKKTAKPVHANRGIELAYKRAIKSLVDQMHKSVQYWVSAEYKKNPPKMEKVVAQDALPPSAHMQYMLETLADRWTKKFDESAPLIAENAMDDMFKYSDAAFKSALKAAGWSVKFTMTPAMRDALNAKIQKNIELIMSIPAEYLQQVQGSVMRSYSAGRDLGAMVKEINRIYPKAANRAVLIARDQSNKANAVVNRTRQMELGITEAIWLHSSGGKEPRQSHVNASGKKYKLAEGCLIDGEYIFPGEKISCRCVSRAVLPF